MSDFETMDYDLLKALYDLRVKRYSSKDTV